MNPNVYTVGIEHEGFAGHRPEAQIQAGAVLVADVCGRYNIAIDRMRVVGHHEIYAGHDCPSSGCPIDRIVQLAAGLKSAAPPPVQS